MSFQKYIYNNCSRQRKRERMFSSVLSHVVGPQCVKVCVFSNKYLKTFTTVCTNHYVIGLLSSKKYF